LIPGSALGRGHIDILHGIPALCEDVAQIQR